MHTTPLVVPDRSGIRRVASLRNIAEPGGAGHVRRLAIAAEVVGLVAHRVEDAALDEPRLERVGTHFRLDGLEHDLLVGGPLEVTGREGVPDARVRHRVVPAEVDAARLEALRLQRHVLFNDAFQDALAEMYRDTGAGDEPHPPAMLCMALILQGYVGASDAEAVELCLFESADDGRESQRITLPEHTDQVWHAYLPDVLPGDRYVLGIAVTQTTIQIGMASGFAVGAIVAERYRIDAKIGQGGMAAVFRAHDLELGEDIAMKLFLQPNDDPQLLARFKQEFRSRNDLVHTNLATLYELCWAEAGQWFCTR